jgi:hypothetical protein
MIIRKVRYIILMSVMEKNSLIIKKLQKICYVLNARRIIPEIVRYERLAIYKNKFEFYYNNETRKINGY